MLFGNYVLLGKFIRQHLVKTELSFSVMFEMSTSRNHEKYDALLPKKQTNNLVMSCDFLMNKINKIHNIRIKSLHLVLLNIFHFEAIL